MSTATKKLNSERLYKVVHIKEAQNQSLRRPIDPTVHKDVRICLERARLVTESYQATEGQPWILRRARALQHLFENMTIYILEGEEIVGNYASSPEAISTFPEFSFQWLEKGLRQEFSHTLSEAEKKEFSDLHQYWADKNVEHEFVKAVPEDLQDYVEWTGGFMGTWFWPLGVIMPDYGNRAFRLGLKGILEEIGRNRQELSLADKDYQDKNDFYAAAEISCRAVIYLARRYASLAAEKAATADEPAKSKYRTIAAICERVPEHPPETFQEALQSFFFYHLVTSQIEYCSVGMGQRFDQLFYPYYIKDKKDGTIDYERAVELLEHLWIKLDDLGQINNYTSAMIQVGGTKFQNCTIGGVDAEGNDATNELSFAIIDATMNIRTLQPALILRYHEAINPDLVDKALDCIATGIGMPAIFNDNAAIPWHYEIALTHARPATGPLFGIRPGLLAAIQGVRASNFFKAAGKRFRAVLPKGINKRLDDTFYLWPYKIATSHRAGWALLRKILAATTLWDTKKSIALSREWSSTACVGGGLRGLSLNGLASVICAGILNYLKCLEYVLYQGVDPATGEQLGAATPDPRTFQTYEEFLEAYCVQVRDQVTKMGRLYAISERLYSQMTPRPFASCLMDSPVSKGRDVLHEGDLEYSEIFSMGSVNTADALAVIKKLVFEDKVVSMEQLIEALRANWQGHELLRKRCLEVPKFGNDDDYVDMLLADVYRRLTVTVKGLRDHFGKPFSPEATLAGGYFAGGLSTGATPDGRRSGETIADGQISPMHGRDTQGPTAVLKSVSKVDPNRTWNQLFNQKFSPDMVSGPNRPLFTAYLKTWAEFNNWHIQFNCIDSDTLRDARENPESHRDLIVRVAGYSAFFTDLTPGLQDDIITRTEQKLACGRG
ncbi:MAG: pyruvate formate lyase family protein [Desulfosudaceae bacterium]